MMDSNAPEIVRADAKIRELRWAILFAQSEPEFFPYPDTDPDTGVAAPFHNDHPTNMARSLVYEVTKNPCAMHILAEFGWTESTADADWNTMLSCLPTLTIERQVTPPSHTPEPENQDEVCPFCGRRGNTVCDAPPADYCENAMLISDPARV